MKDEHRDANLAAWDERAPEHAKTTFYDLDGFVAGRRSGLHASEPSELGPIAGKSLVQLQCHLGVEALAWARLGAARVVGLDFSPQAIAAARVLAERCGLRDRAEFVVSDVDDAARALAPHLPFDVCYVSVGALIWLPSVKRWAEICAAMLAPGGVLYMREVHPMLGAVSRVGDQLVVNQPYFETEDPTSDEEEGSYAAPEARFQHNLSYSWNRGLGEIVQALLDAGFQLELLHEHRDAEWQALPHMSRDDHGYYHLPLEQRDQLPLTFSLRARKR